MKRIISNYYNKCLTYGTKKFGLDLEYFFNGGFWLFLNELTNVSKGFILSILFANFISKEMYGEFTFMWTIIAIGTLFALSGLPITIVRSLAKNYDETYINATKMAFKWATLGSIFIIIVGTYNYLFNQQYTIVLFLMIALLLPCYAYSMNYQAALYGKKKFKLLFLFNFIFSSIYICSIIISIIFNLTIFWLVLITLIMQILLNTIFHFYITNNLLKNKKNDESGLIFGKKISLPRGLSAVLLRGDSLIITYFLGFQALAIYTLISLIPTQIRFGFKSLTPMLLTKFSIIEINKKTIMKYFYIVSLFSIILISGYGLISEYIFKYLYPQYYEYYFLSIIFAITLLVIPGTFLEVSLQAKLSDKIINFVNISSSLLNLLLMIPLLIIFNILGVVLANVISRVYITIIYFIYYIKLK